MNLLFREEPDAGISFERLLRQSLKPDDLTSVVDYLERTQNAVPYSPNTGRFRVNETPWIREPLETIFDPEKRIVVILAAVQLAKSLIMELAGTVALAKYPGPTFYLTHTGDAARTWSESRLLRLWPENSDLAPLMPPARARTWNSLVVNGAQVWVDGAKSENPLQSKSVRWLFIDEAWKVKKGNLAEAMARTNAFKHLAKTVVASQGSEAGDDFDTLWQSTDCRAWSFCCPRCRFVQPYDWKGITLPDNCRTDDGFDFKAIRLGTRYSCQSCGGLLEDTDAVRYQLNAGGVYVPKNGNASAENVGFTWNALVGRPWGYLAEKWSRASLEWETKADPIPRKIFLQKELARMYQEEVANYQSDFKASDYRLGQAWEEEGGVDTKSRILVDRFDPADPNQIRLRFLTVDCQRNGFYCLVRSWSTTGSSRLVAWLFVSSWEEVAAFREKWEVSNLFVFVDAGDRSEEVFRACGKFGGWIATRGSKKTEFPWKLKTPKGFKTLFRFYSRPRPVATGSNCRLYYFSTLNFKDALFRLRLTGTHTFPIDAGDDYSDQMASEVRRRRRDGKPIWEQIGNRANHLFDCETLQLLPAYLLRLVDRQTKKPAAGGAVETPAKAETDDEGESVE
jgi:phage terminase large subunit GpA-like protein